MMRAITDTMLLTRRALREAIRQPGNELANAFIPIFFYVVTIGAIGDVAKQAFNVADYKGFQLPVAILQGAAGIASGAGLAMTLDIQSGYFEKLLLTSTPRFAIVLGRMLSDAILQGAAGIASGAGLAMTLDIQSGYFEKLLLTSTPRFAIVLGRMLSDAIKSMVLSVAIIVLAIAVGSHFETGVIGAVALVLAAGLFALAYSGMGMAIALKTGSPQAAQAGFILFFPLLFMAPTFAPLDVFADWLAWIARFNPVTYLLEGMRVLIVSGWDWLALLKGAAAIAGIGIVTFTMTGLAMRGRVS